MTLFQNVDSEEREPCRSLPIRTGLPLPQPTLPYPIKGQLTFFPSQSLAWARVQVSPRLQASVSPTDLRYRRLPSELWTRCWSGGAPRPPAPARGLEGVGAEVSCTGHGALQRGLGPPVWRWREGVQAAGTRNVRVPMEGCWVLIEGGPCGGSELGQTEPPALRAPPARAGESALHLS